MLGTKTSRLTTCPHEPCGQVVPVLGGCPRHGGIGRTATRIRSVLRDRGHGYEIKRGRCDDAEHGSCTSERWGLSGFLHRLDGPAVTHRWPDGAKRTESFHVAGRPHRIGGPQFTRWNSEGLVIEEEWRMEDKRHRVDGPAIHHRYGHYGMDWWFLNEPVNGPAQMSERLRRVGSDRAWRLVGESSYGALLREGVPMGSILDALDRDVWSPDGIRQVAAGAPAEWVQSFESAAVHP